MFHTTLDGILLYYLHDYALKYVKINIGALQTDLPFGKMNSTCQFEKNEIGVLFKVKAREPPRAFHQNQKPT